MRNGMVLGTVVAAWSAAGAAAMCAGCAAEGPYCDRVEAEAALASAEAGDTVQLGACEVQGPLHVPPGVRLAGTDGTVVVAPVDSGGIVLLGGDPATAVTDLEVRVEGRVGVLARDAGAAEIRAVRIDARRGIGIGASGLDRLTLEDVVIAGPIDESNAAEGRWVRVAPAAPAPAACPAEPCDCEPGSVDAAGERVCDETGRWATWTATYGLFLGGVASAELTNLEVQGFAQWGVVLRASEVTWTGGGVRDTIGVGVRQVGGTLDLRDVSVERSHEGVRGDSPYGVAATDGGRLEGAGVTVADNDRYGVLLSGATGHLRDLVATDNGDAALWVADSDDFELSGAGTQLSDNEFAGAVIVSSGNVRLADGSVEGTREVERVVGLLGRLRVGDGVHLTRSTGAVDVADLALRNNARAGLVAEVGGGGAAGLTFEGVTIEGQGDQLGAIAGQAAGDGTLSADSPAGWDAGITRVGSVDANDATFSGTLHAVTESLPEPTPMPQDAVSVVAPMF